MPAFEVFHVALWPVSTLPLASFTVSCSVVELPAVSVGLAGAIATLAAVALAGAVTVRAACPVIPSLVAMIVAVPTATALTSPVLATVATLLLLELHVIARPVSIVPLASFNVAVAWVLWPAVNDPLLSKTPTLATGTGGGGGGGGDEDAQPTRWA